MSSYRGRTNEFEERDYYSAPRRGAVEFEDDRVRTTRTVTRSPPARPRRDVEEILRQDSRRAEAGPMILRREVETFDRRRPSPTRVREERIVRRAHSVTPSLVDHEHEHERERTRVIERERERVRSPSVVRRRSPSPVPIRYVHRRRRSSSVSSSDHEHEHIHTRIVERERGRERVPSPSPSPSPPPQTIRGPTVERDVITHYTNIDHGTIQVRPPSPPPAPRPRPRVRERETRETRETDIDISLSKHHTEVDIHRSTSRTRSKSRERRSHYHDDDLVIRREERLRVDDSHRRARSAAPRSPVPVDEEADYITSKIDSRGRMGEARGGATKDWAIVDVPPGTERVRMEGIGGASTDTKWSKYSGVRRTQFIPERDEIITVPKQPSPPPAPKRERLSVSVYDREREIDIEKITDRRVTRSPHQPSRPPPKEMWTEITKDLVCREAIEQMGYSWEETEHFFYVMEYLRYDDVLRLTELTEGIRRAKRHRKWDREGRDEYDWDRWYHDHHLRRPQWDDERVRETEVIYDTRGPTRGYLR